MLVVANAERTSATADSSRQSMERGLRSVVTVSLTAMTEEGLVLVVVGVDAVEGMELVLSVLVWEETLL